jgi:hypothetical protein
MKVLRNAVTPARSAPACSYFWKNSRHRPTSVRGCSDEIYHSTTWQWGTGTPGCRLLA